jgi:hypothetical protein
MSLGLVVVIIVRLRPDVGVLAFVIDADTVDMNRGGRFGVSNPSAYH